MKKVFLSILISAIVVSAQAQKQDTVIVELAKTSRVIFTIRDRSDLETLKAFDFDKLFDNIIEKLERNDSTVVVKNDSSQHRNPRWQEGDNDEVAWTQDGDDNNNNNDNHDWNVYRHSNHRGRTWQSFNFGLGTNNYLQDGKFPDNTNELYSVRPWGSWYLEAASIQRTRLGKKFFLEWGLGMSWYAFKFQEDNVLITKDDAGITFSESDIEGASYKKSKLSASYIMATLVPIIDFGDNNRKPRIFDGYGNSFRIGIGPYIGYRVGSHSKLVYKVDGETEKDKNFSNLYLNNLRYGARLQLGYRSTDLFFNYDINELFVEGKGPSLNAFSFGIVF